MPSSPDPLTLSPPVQKPDIAMSETPAQIGGGAARKPVSFGWRIVGALGVGALLAACFPPFNLPFLLPIAVAALLALLPGLEMRHAVYLGFACGMTFFGIALSWLTSMFGTASIALWAICAVFPALFCGLVVRLGERLPRVPLWLIAAVAWTACEYFRSEWMIPSFGFMGLGYALVNAPILAAFAAWFGSYGLTFAVVAFGAVLLRGSVPVRLGCLALWLALLFVPHFVPTLLHPLSVRLVQANSEDDESLFRLSRLAPGQHADVIVWPEYSFVSDPQHNPKLWSQLTRLPQNNHAYFLFGAKDQFDMRDEAAYHNTAFLLAPDGRVIGRHVKNHTLPFFRDGVAGTDANVFSTPLGRLGVAICFDMDFPDVARRLTANGAELFLVPSDNPLEWGDRQRVQHRQMFQMRAAECGRWLATTDVAGNTFVVAPTGKIVQSVHTSDPVVLDAEVGRATGETPYIRFGWLFGPVCFWALVLLCVRAALPARFLRKSQEAAT